MRLRTKIVLAITSMVALLVAGFSYIYISQLLRQKVTDTYDQCKTIAYQLVFDTREAIPDLSSTKVDVNNPAAVPPYSFSLLCRVLRLICKISAALVLLLLVEVSVFKMSCRSASSTVVPTPR